MGEPSSWYFKYYTSFFVLFVVQWIYMFVIVIYYGSSCRQSCPLITINVSAAVKYGLPVSDLNSSDLAVAAYYPCDEFHGNGYTGYCMTKSVCQSAISIQEMSVQQAFDDRCFYCGINELSNALEVFGPAPQSLAPSKWIPMSQCGEPVSQGGFNDLPLNILPNSIVDQPASLYNGYVYPGGVGKSTLCWDIPIGWVSRDSVFDLEIMMLIFCGLLSLTSFYCVIICRYFTNVHQSDWKKLSRCEKILTCIYRRIVLPVQVRSLLVKFFHLLSLLVLLNFFFL